MSQLHLTELHLTDLWPASAVRFPGATGWFVLPDDRRLARSGIAAYSASRPRAAAVQTAAWVVAATMGPRALGPRRPVPCPLPIDQWAELVAQWREALGPVDALVPLLRRQPERAGFAVLLHFRGRRVAFVKLRRGSAGVEPAVLTAAEGLPLQAITVPRLLGAGQAGPWHWCATEPLADRLHRPGAPDLHAVAAEAGAVVAAALPRPSGTPLSWTAAHGDLTPWNVRTAGSRSTVPHWAVLDWEDATYAPPHTDAVGYVAAAAAARGRAHAALPVSDADEAVRWWLSTLSERGLGSDAAYSARLTAVLSTWLPAPQPVTSRGTA